MVRTRGKSHTTLTETAALVVSILEKQTGIKMIAPGIIKTNARGSRGKRYITAAYTTAGMELIITGQSVQKVAVHTDTAKQLFQVLKTNKKLTDFTFKERERKPGV